MNFNYKLYFKYILFNLNQFFFKYLLKNYKNLNIFIYQQNLYYLILHLKLSSLFYSTQLIDIFSYELPINLNLNKNKKLNVVNQISTLLVYNFHIINSQQRIFIFVINNLNKNINKTFINWTLLNSITENFLNANWLEREVSELHGIFFINKKDLRNLLLQYGDNSAPMLKNFPSIGLREIFYDSINDLLIQNSTTIQY